MPALKRTRGLCRAFFGLLKKAGAQAFADRAPAMGAALAFYSILSLGPLLLLALAGAAVIFGEDAARGRIMNEFAGLLGPRGAQTVGEILGNAAPHHKAGTTLLGILTLVFGASQVFRHLQASLNLVWRVRVKKGVFSELVWQRLLSFAMVLSTGFLLLVSLLFGVALTAVETYVAGLVPGFFVIARMIDVWASFGIAAFLFALIFKYVPDVHIGWRPAFIGGALTAALFILGKFLIGLYLGRAGVASGYGAAGSAVLLLLWVYYSSQILLFGAEFTYAFACEYEPDGGPTPQARRVDGAKNNDR